MPSRQPLLSKCAKRLEMLTSGKAWEILADETLIIDGGLATELENRGHDLSHPLWSGKILINDPAAIRQVHLDYFLAGANIVITASYQASEWGLSQHLDMQRSVAAELIKRSVVLAQEARTLAFAQGVPTDRKLLVAGSVGPYGAYLADGSEYTGSYERNGRPITKNDLEAFHTMRIDALIDAGVDMLMLETMPSFLEIQAIATVLARYAPASVTLLSCTLRDAQHISDGTSIQQVIEFISDSDNIEILAFGVNCVAPDLVTDFLQTAQACNEDMMLFCYPNSGELYDGVSKQWSGDSSHSALADNTDRWLENGAIMIGGCCRTTPAHIAALVGPVREYEQRVNGAIASVQASRAQLKAIVLESGGTEEQAAIFMEQDNV